MQKAKKLTGNRVSGSICLALRNSEKQGCDHVQAVLLDHFSRGLLSKNGINK